MVQASGKYLIVALGAVLSVACLVTGSSVDVSLFYLFILRELFAFELTFFFSKSGSSGGTSCPFFIEQSCQLCP